MPSAAGVTGPTSVHDPPKTRCSSETPAMPRMSPVRVTDDPYGSGAIGVGCWRDIIEMLNHVERSPRAPLTVPPPKDGALVVLTESDGNVSTDTRLTRPDRSSVVCRSRIDPFTLSAFANVWALIGSGPQLWYGESTSNGSATETRYGTGATPQPAEIDSVSPPELEKKNVAATLPAYMTTCPLVASTAAFVAGVSCETPRYSWLRVSA